MSLLQTFLNTEKPRLPCAAGLFFVYASLSVQLKPRSRVGIFVGIATSMCGYFVSDGDFDGAK